MAGSYLKKLMARYIKATRRDDDDTTAACDNNESDEQLAAELQTKSNVIKEELPKLIVSDPSLELSLLGSILVKYGSVELVSWFLTECIESIRQRKLKPNAVDALISVVGVGGAPHKALSVLFDRIQALIEANSKEDTWFRCLELLPIIIPLLNAPTVDAEEIVDDYRLLLRDVLLQVDFKTPICIPILSILSELNLSPDDMADILQKAIEMADNIAPNDLPSFCYYALLASRRCNNCNNVFNQIITLLTHFEQQNRDNNKARPVLGTVLLHLTLAVRQDSMLLKEVLGLAKTPPLKLLHSVFFASFLLALSASPPYSESIYPFFRNHILRHLKFSDRCSHALWLSKLGDAVGGTLPVTEVLSTAAKQAYTESVAESAVHFSFFMLDSLTGGMALNTVSSNACVHAVAMITSAFQSSEAAQETILSLLFERLLSSGSASPVRGRFLRDIVRQLVMKGPHFLMAHSAKLRQLIDYLPSFPVATAEDLIKTLMLLFRVNISLRDALLLLLRKLLFSRKLEHRILAAKGYIQFLLNFKVVGGLASTQPSQALFSASQFQNVKETGKKTGEHVVNPASRAGNDALCLEILGILKRCLDQQMEVRRVIYSSLPDVLHKNSQLVEPVLALLSNDLKEFAVDFGDGHNRSMNTTAVNSQSTSELHSDGDLPLLFSRCIKKNEVRCEIIEPIADLLFCINRCLAEADRLEPEDRPDICDQLRCRLWEIGDGILFANIHELLPNKEDPEGDSLRCQLVVCTLAALLEVAYNDAPEGSNRNNRNDLLNLSGFVAPTQALGNQAKRNLRVLSLFARMIRVSDAIPLGGPAGGKKGGKPKGGKAAAGGKKGPGGGKDKKGGGNANRLASLMTILNKHSDSTANFVDIGFCEQFIEGLLTAVRGNDPNVRLTRSERDHEHLFNLLAFLIQSAAKCHFKENRRLTEAAYRLARLSMDVVNGTYDGLQDEMKTFRGGALEFLQAVFTQLTDTKSNNSQAVPAVANGRQASVSVATLRNLLMELNLSAEEDENELRLAFVGQFFERIRQLISGTDASSKDVLVGRDFAILINLVKSISASSSSDGDGENLSPPAEKANEEIARLCKETDIGHAAAVRCAFDYLLDAAYRTDRKYRTLLGDIAEDVSKKLGRSEVDADNNERVSPAPSHGVFCSISPNNAASCVVAPVLHHVEVQLGDVNFVLDLIRLWLLGSGNENSQAVINPSNPGQKLGKVRDAFWKSVFETLHTIVRAMKDILESELTSQHALLTSLRTITKLYDSLWRSSKLVLGALTSLKDKPAGWLPAGFDKLVDATGSNFQKTVYDAMLTFQSNSEAAVRKKAKMKDKAKGKAKKAKKRDGDDEEEDEEEVDEAEEPQQRAASSTRLGGSSSLEAKLLPSLIFAIEQYEQMILRLSKRKGLHNLVANMKRSTARDFRIKLDNVAKGGGSPNTQRQQRQRSSQAGGNIPPAPTTSSRKRDATKVGSGGSVVADRHRRPLASRQSSDDQHDTTVATTVNDEDDDDERPVAVLPPPPTTTKRRKLLPSSQAN